MKNANTEDFHNNYTECKICNSNRSLKRYYENKDKKSNEKKNFYEKNRYKLIQKQNNRYLIYKELYRSDVELLNRIKTMEEKLINFNSTFDTSIRTSKIIKKLFK